MTVAEADQERGPADPDDHGGSADDRPAVLENLDKGSAAEVKRVFKQVAPPGKDA